MPEEADELANWRKESPKNEKLFQKLVNSKNKQDYLNSISAFDTKEGWTQLLKKHNTWKRKRFFNSLYKYAAIWLIPLLIAGAALITYTHKQLTTTNKDIAHISRQIEPGKNKARLLLDNGKTINLDNKDNLTMKEKDGTVIHIDSATINYRKEEKPRLKSKKEEKIIYNQLETPQGGEYKLTLSDGTKVHLNAMSSLRFPVDFSEEARMVEVTGEAFFEVANDKRPFIVKARSQQIKVLGTVFNISTYENEIQQTTLVSGKVMLTTVQGDEYYLEPSDQASINLESGTIDIQKVNVALYTSWVTGKIYFKDETLEHIMTNLSRWYDMEVEFANEETRQLKFGCNIDRYNDIEPLLQLFKETGGVEVLQEGKKIKLTTKPL